MVYGAMKELEEMPYQWLIDELAEDIAFWERHGMDKIQPELFKKLKSQLERARQKQDPHPL
jgi:hypothetical protein